MWTFISSDDGTNNWFCEESPDNKYSISANVIEQPFLNGSTNVAIYIYSNEKKVNTLCFTSYIKNNGKDLDNSNYSITWSDEYALLTIQ